MFTLSGNSLELLEDVPTYTYKCTACDEVIEKRQSFSDTPLTTCEQCGGALRKVIHPVGIVFKGSGWYITDSRSSSSNGRSGSTSSDKESPSKSAETSAGKDSGSDKDSNASSSTPSTPSPSSPSSPSTTKSGSDAA
jgi:putative FmdB family regulatory protein